MNLIRVVSCELVYRIAVFAVLGLLFILCLLCVSVVSFPLSKSARETQGAELDYSKFLHTSQRHSSLGCTECHDRTPDNSPTPRFPGHKACSNCHLSQFVTPAVAMCLICHTDTKSSNPPLKSFPSRFNESFNVKFD